MTRGRPKNNAGFTLLEIVLVLVVIMIIAGMVAPRLFGLAHGRGAIELSEQMESLARFARGEAVAKSTTYVINIDSKAGTFWLSTEDGPDGGVKVSTVLKSELDTHKSIPADIVITYISGLEDSTNTTNGSVDSIRFYPDGRTDPGTIQIRSPDGIISINCPSATESYRVAKAGT